MNCEEIPAQAVSSTGLKRDNTLRQFNSQVLGIPTPVGNVPVAYAVRYSHDGKAVPRVMVQYGVSRRSFNEILPEFRHTIKGKKSFTYKFNGLETYYNADKDETSFKRKKGFAVFELPYSRTFYNGALFYRSDYAVKGSTCCYSYPVDDDHDSRTEVDLNRMRNVVRQKPRRSKHTPNTKCNCGAN